ncbi:MAG: ATP-binding protein [Pseudomonadota bacterium]
MEDVSPAKALRTLRLLGVLSLAIPLLIYATFGAFRFFDSSALAEKRVSRSLRVAYDHASNVLKSAEASQDRLLDQVARKTLPELRDSEANLHNLLLAYMKDRPQIQSIWIIGADGAPIATSRFFPVQKLDFQDRAYFQFHKSGQGGRFLSAPFVSRTTGEKIVDISARFNGPEGQFGGVVNISLYASYFERFYADLVSDEPGLAVNLFHQDGSIYTRWPLVENAPDRLGPNSPVMKRVLNGEEFAQFRGISSVDGADRLLSFRRIGAYPMYVGTGMNLSIQRYELLKELALLLGLGLVPFAALFYTAQVAYRRTRDALESAERLRAETTTRQRAEDALRQAQKLEALGRLTGGVAHDFNNALMVISNNSFLLKRHVAEAGQKQLSSIMRAVDSATKLTRQLLAFSRRQALVPERVQLQERLPSVTDLIGPVLGSQIALSVSVEPDTKPVTVDWAELELALLNLGINARDAMPGGGKFSISARNLVENVPDKVGREAVLIEAADTGTGIEPAALAKVFEPFFTTKPVGEGTGLGLAQVYALCDRAGGVAEIHSTVGVGTRVCLYFPPAHGAVGEAAHVPAPIKRDLGKSVLLIEDNNQVAGALIPLLEALGCTVTRLDRADAARGWLAAQERLPDVVLTDVVMPGELDGIGLAKALRQERPDLPLVLMTGYAEQLESIAALGFEVLPKPCSAEVLSAALARATGITR